MSKNVSTAAEQIAEPVEPEVRKLPEIDPKLVRINYHGDSFKEVVVRLPAEAIADNLKEGALWARVQKSPQTSLRKMDRVIILAHDEGFLWEAYVAEAGPESVTLSTPKRHELKPRRSAYFSDGVYKVKWNGLAFDVVRMADNHVMRTGLANEPLAVRAIQALYPQAVG